MRLVLDGLIGSRLAHRKCLQNGTLLNLPACLAAPAWRAVTHL